MNKLLAHNNKIREEMLKEINISSLNDLFKNIDIGIKLQESLDLPEGINEIHALQKLSSLAKNNTDTAKAAYFIGGGCYNKFSPSCISALIERSEFLTAYTPYQPEISQGTLQAIYEYQTMICNLTGLDVSNAGVYDGATACAEAILMACRIKKRNKALVSSTVNPNYLKVIETYANAKNIQIDVIPKAGIKTNLSLLKDLETDEYSSILIPYTNYFGEIEELDKVSDFAKENNLLFIVAADPSTLSILEAPSEFLADMVVGDIQTLGLPMAFGGPHAGFMTTKKDYMRQLPGRIVGMTFDKTGKRAFTLTQQAREQHIRREKATGNICSNQALCTLSATIYMSVMGHAGILELLENSVAKAHLLAKKFSQIEGFKILNDVYLNEFVVKFPDGILAKDFISKAENENIFAGIPLDNEFESLKNCILVSLTELNSSNDIYKYVKLLTEYVSGEKIV